ncbi:MAG: hypothetical protein Q7U38_14180 [Methylobacter sp.]|nr:hypothetical protein [Methylobacter sp.]MDP2429042.1 hypothetical protein [Methylobacter sp.]MDP3056543.1 hypothetical protein [Methylobacter sp.]MDP3362032.1 hypothetical protein [Methylobacter sp.]MDZ4221059.1 hypothetical protein [Methylobacter sp.]
MNYKQRVATIKKLMGLAQAREVCLGCRMASAGYGAPPGLVNKVLTAELLLIKQQGREAVFDLLLHSTPGQFLAFLREVEGA